MSKRKRIAHVSPKLRPAKAYKVIPWPCNRELRKLFRDGIRMQVLEAAALVQACGLPKP